MPEGDCQQMNDDEFLNEDIEEDEEFVSTTNYSVRNCKMDEGNAEIK